MKTLHICSIGQMQIIELEEFEVKNQWNRYVKLLNETTGLTISLFEGDSLIALSGAPVTAMINMAINLAVVKAEMMGYESPALTENQTTFPFQFHRNGVKWELQYSNQDCFGDCVGWEIRKVDESLNRFINQYDKVFVDELTKLLNTLKI